MSLIHPVLYVDLVYELATKDNWEIIVDKFNELTCENIECHSIPLWEYGTKKEICNWWETIEQKSIKYSFEYECMMRTDISDCYGSLYLHSISWALAGIEISKKYHHSSEEKRNNNFTTEEKRKCELGGKIEALIQNMQYGQTNGLPQGSTLTNLIAELVLCFVDKNLENAIASENNERKTNHLEPIGKYKILRYRDDYRIFGENEISVAIIAKLLSVELQKLNFKLNADKTLVTGNIIRYALKDDKCYYIEHPLLEENFQKRLIGILLFSEKYPNTGTMSKLLSETIDKTSTPYLSEQKGLHECVAILTEILVRNPKVYSKIIVLIGRILSVLETKERLLLIDSIVKKTQKIYNKSLLEIWIQRLTIKYDRGKEYGEKLCLVAKTKSNDYIWNSSWIKEESPLKQIMSNTSIIDENELAELSDIPELTEVDDFRNY